MATGKQTAAARSNVKKAQKAANSKKTLAHIPAKTKTKLGKQGVAVAQRKRTVGSTPRTRTELYEIAKERGIRMAENAITVRVDSDTILITAARWWG
jgi:hypothetical protein